MVANSSLETDAVERRDGRGFRNPRLYALFFGLDFCLSLVMLTTDSNLRTDFGTMTGGYFLHWYFILVTAVADLAGMFLLLILRSPTAVKVGVAGSLLMVVFFLGAIFTYAQVGFSSATEMADYLLGITYYGGDVRYLYDVLLAAYMATFIYGAAVLASARHPRSLAV